MPNLQIFVIPRIIAPPLVESMKHSVPALNPIVISINDPGDPPVKFNLPETHILRQQFHDVEDNYPADAPHVIKFTTTHAWQIKHFILHHLQNSKLNDALIIHCEAGISRSPAVAAAIANRYLGDDQYQRFFQDNLFLPNKLVYNTLLSVLNTKIAPKRKNPANPKIVVHGFEDYEITLKELEEMLSVCLIGANAVCDITINGITKTAEQWQNEGVTG